MTVSEQRPLDNITIVGAYVVTVSLPTGSKLIDVIDIASIAAGTTVTVKVFRVDPGGKSKLGSAIITTAALNAVAVTETEVDEAAGARFTGLFRVEHTLGGTAISATLTHTLTCKD